MASSISFVLATYLILGNNVEHGYGTEKVCYPELGCFSMEDPWRSLTRPFPEPHSPEKINVQLYCFTRACSSLRYTVSVWPKICLNGFPYNAAKKTVFITHGFATDGNETWLHTFKDYMLQQVDASVCIVDWGNGAKRFNYLQVASTTRVVGAIVARFIKYLQCEYKLQPKDVHLIGHSLGAQICSYIAKDVSDIGRLTALDPAQPGFELEDKQVRLDKSDACFVEAIHTNARPFMPFFGFGMMSQCGHVDYYMNGGAQQPGCILPKFPEITSITELAKIPVEVIINLVSCSHGRAIEYYMNVLNDNCTIWARKSNIIEDVLNVLTLGGAGLLSSTDPCTEDNCIRLGLDAYNDKARGVFCASTSSDEPFCDDPETVSRIWREIKASDNNNSKGHTCIQDEAADMVKNVLCFGK